MACRIEPRPSIPVRVRKVGFFPNPHAPRVFWCGVEAPGLDGLAAGIAAMVCGLIALLAFWTDQLAMAILMLPTIIRTTEEMLKLVPHSLREASLGLGAPEWKTSLRVIFPADTSSS